MATAGMAIDATRPSGCAEDTASPMANSATKHSEERCIVSSKGKDWLHPIADRGHGHRPKVTAIETAAVVGRGHPHRARGHRITPEGPVRQRAALGVRRQRCRIWNPNTVDDD